MIELSIIIPAYNEEERLPETLALLRDWVEQRKESIEVIVVDDGSTDKTIEVVESTIERIPSLRLIKSEQNQGKGGAVRVGMLSAQGEWRLFMDADGSTPLNQIDKLLAERDSYEVIIGSRYLESESIKIKQPLRRRILSRFGNLMIRWMVLPGVRDTQCGCKLFSAKATEEIFIRQRVSGWLFDVEILRIARELGYKIKEVPVDWYDAKQSKLRAVQTGFTTFRELRQIHAYAKNGAYHTPPNARSS